MEDLFSWLDKEKYLVEIEGYKRYMNGNEDLSNNLDPFSIPVLGMPCHRQEKKTKADLDAIREGKGKSFSRNLSDTENDWAKIWEYIRKPKEAVKLLDLKLMPADSMAFYRPFHFKPVEEWGIYLIVPKLLKYFETLFRSFSKLLLFTHENLAVTILFEIFHHEFFHHLVETTATVMEIIYAGIGNQRKFYLDYLIQKHKTVAEKNPYEPLEEGLANAYAYNSFSFISRVKTGYMNGLVRLYQQVLEKYWRFEPPGYRDAGNYIKGGQIPGGASLLAKLLSNEAAIELPLEILSSSVFPSGYTAFLAKPDIPTYLVGDETALNLFYTLVPAPNEAYTNLYWPGDSKALDAFIEKKRKEKRDIKKTFKGG